MPIRFACPGCRTSFTVNARLAGKKLECQSCGRDVTVPGSAPAVPPARPPLPPSPPSSPPGAGPVPIDSGEHAAERPSGVRQGPCRMLPPARCSVSGACHLSALVSR
jgi:hypothetical protein